MRPIDSALCKVRRVAVASLRNAVRLHEDAVLLFRNGRIPSALHTSVLAIEEIGKYYMHEDVWWHNHIGPQWTIQDIQEFLGGAFSHIHKHAWFASECEDVIPMPILRLIRSGTLEAMKQRSTYVGLGRRRGTIDLRSRLATPFGASKKRVETLITLVNDYFISQALGVRKGMCSAEIPEIEVWFAQAETEQRFLTLWPSMRPVTRRRVERMRRFEDAEEWAGT